MLLVCLLRSLAIKYNNSKEYESSNSNNKEEGREEGRGNKQEKNVSRRPRGSKAILRRLVDRSAYYTTTSNIA